MKITAMPLSKELRFKLHSTLSPRGLLLFLLPLPLIPALMISLAKGNLTKTLVHLTALALFMTGAVLLRRGLTRDIESEYRRVITTPGVPLKTLGGAAVALATFVCGYFALEHNLVFSVTLMLLALAGYYLSYGLDPLRNPPTIVSAHGVTSEEVTKALVEAEQKIAAIEQAGRIVQNPELRQRLRRIVELAREILTVIEDDPRDLPRAQKFLYVYLEGAEKVCAGYARTHSKVASPQLEGNFRNVLATIEGVFVKQRQRLLENDVMDLDVQIEVLANQLKREGIT